MMKSKFLTHLYYIIGILLATAGFLTFYWPYVDSMNFLSLGVSFIFGTIGIVLVSEYSVYIKKTTKYQPGSIVSWYGPKGVLITGTLLENFWVWHKVQYPGLDKTGWVLSHQIAWVGSI